MPISIIDLSSRGPASCAHRANRVVVARNRTRGHTAARKRLPPKRSAQSVQHASRARRRQASRALVWCDLRPPPHRSATCITNMSAAVAPPSPLRSHRTLRSDADPMGRTAIGAVPLITVQCRPRQNGDLENRLCEPRLRFLYTATKHHGQVMAVECLLSLIHI